MALFKIHKGERFPESGQITKATEGFAYFTTEDGKFYIDISGNGNVDAVIRDKEHPLGNRVPLNAAQADYVKNNFILKILNGTTENNTLYTFNGSEEKTLNIITGSGIEFITANNLLTIEVNASMINSGILPTAYGGTGNNTYLANRLIYSETNTKLNSANNIHTDGNSINFLKDDESYVLITNKYNNVSYALLRDHHNGDISLSASSGNLYLGYANTNGLYLYAGKNSNNIANRSAFIAVGNSDTATTFTNYKITYGTGGSSSQPVYVDSYGKVQSITGALANNITGNAATATAANITSTDNAIVRFDGTTGKFQNSNVTIDDNGYIDSTQFKTSSSETILNNVGYITIYPYDRNTYGNTTPTPAKFIFTEKAYTTGVPAKTLVAWSGIDNIKIANFIGALKGNADTATQFKDDTTVQLTGDVTGSATSKRGWTIETTIGAGKVTNAMLAGSIANNKLVNSYFKIDTNKINLGDTVTSTNLKSWLGLTNAAHYIGKATNEITDGGTEDPGISGYNFSSDRKSGDIVLGKNGDKEYIWGLNGWEQLGPVDTIQTSTAAGTANRLAYYSANNMISSGDIVTNGKYLSKITYLTIDADHQTNYKLYVNGTSYFNNVLQTGRYFHNVASYQTSVTPKEILIKTKIPFTNGIGMPKIMLHMYSYYSHEPTEISIGFYIYNNAFCNYGATSNTSSRPIITLSTYVDGNNTYIAIGLGLIGTANYPNAYYLRFNVDVLDIYWGTGQQDRNFCNGWTIESNTSSTSFIPTDNRQTVEYKDQAQSALKWTNPQKVYVALGTQSVISTIQGGSSTAQTIGVNGILSTDNGGTGNNVFEKDRLIFTKTATQFATGTIESDGNNITLANGDYSLSRVARSGNWNQGASKALIKITSASGAYPLFAMKSHSGYWLMSQYEASGFYDHLMLGFLSDVDVYGVTNAQNHYDYKVRLIPTVYGTNTTTTSDRAFVTAPYASASAVVGSSNLPVYIDSTGVATAVTAVDTSNNLLNALPTSWTATPTDDTLFIRKDTAGAASFGQVKFSTLWTYIKNHITDDLYWADIKVQNASKTDTIPTFKTIYFGTTDPTTSGRGILTFSATYPNHGLWYFNDSTDIITLDGHGYANDKTQADLAINALGAGIISTRNKYIPHTGNTSGTVGTEYIPVYANAGTITQIAVNSVLINLASTTAVSTYAASPRPGVTGKLGTSNGGTGNNSFTEKCAIYSETTTKLSSASSIYMDTSHITVNGTAIPVNSGSFQVIGTSTMRTILPEADATYDLGKADTLRWKNGFFTTALRVGPKNTTATSTTDKNVYIGPDGFYVNSISNNDSGFVLRRKGTNYGSLYSTAEGTTTGLGQGRLILGNSTASGTANNSEGAILLYGDLGYSHQIIPGSRLKNSIVSSNTTVIAQASADSANRTHYLPNASGYLLTINQQAALTMTEESWTKANWNAGTQYLVGATSYGFGYTSDIAKISRRVYADGTNGYSQILLGNNIVNGDPVNSYGSLVLYGNNTGYTNLRSNASTASYSAYLPNSTTNVYLAHVGNTTGVVGGLEQPVYVAANGLISSTTYHLKAHIESGTDTRAAYYKTTTTIEDAGSIYMDDSHIGINGTNTSYQFYVNGTSYFNNNVSVAANYSIDKPGHSISWYQGRDYALIRITSASGYTPLASIKTTNGSWDIGHYTASGYQDKLLFNHITDTTYSAASGSTDFNKKSGWIEMLKDGSMMIGKADIYRDNTAFKNTLILENNRDQESSYATLTETKPSFGIGFNFRWQDGTAGTLAGIYGVGLTNWRAGLAFRVKKTIGTAASPGIHDHTIAWMTGEGLGVYGRLDLNRSANVNYGYLSFYHPNYKTWIEYMSGQHDGSSPQQGKPGVLGNVTSWARRSLIENGSNYGWIWEYGTNAAASEITTVSTTPVMALSPNDGTLFLNGNIIISSTDGETDRSFIFGYKNDTTLTNNNGASWRLVHKASGSGDTNYFAIESSKSTAGNNKAWNNVLRAGMDTFNILLGSTTDISSGNSNTTAAALEVSGGLQTHKSIKIGKYVNNSTAPGYGIRIHDLRNIEVNSDKFGDYSVNWYFHQVNGNRWSSIMSMKGWTGAYAAWEIAGNADTTQDTNTDRYFVRSILGTTATDWHTLVKLPAMAAIGSGEQPVYVAADGTVTKTSYALKAHVEDGSVNHLAYYSAARTIDYTPNIIYYNDNSVTTQGTTTRLQNGLLIAGQTSGNNASHLVSNTAGVMRFGDGGPQLIFSEATSGSPAIGSDAGAILFTNHDSAGTGSSFHFVGKSENDNQGGNLHVTAPNLIARKKLTIGLNFINTSYTLYTRGIANFNIASDNTYGIGGHRLNAIFEGTNHASILIATPTNNHAYGIAVNSNGNMYIGYRNTGSYTSYSGDKYLLILNSTQLYPNTDLEMNLGLSNKRWKDIYGGNFTYNGTIYFGDSLSDSKPILAYSTTYPYFGIYYWNESTDVIAIDGHGKSNSKTEADLAINALGAGIISTRNRYIPHTNNTTGTVGTATRPVYVNAGTITQGSYELKATVNSGTAKQAAYYSAATTISGTSILTIESNRINVTANSNTFSIGSQNANFTHLYNSANIPFIFNKSVLTTAGDLGNTDYPWNNIYLGKGTTRHIYFVGSKATTSMIRFLNETSTTYGNGISIGGGGLTIIGGGESASNFGTGSWTAETEETVVLADNSIWLEAAANTIANRIGFQINGSGNLIPVKAEALNNNAQNIGATNAKLANIYATTFHGTVDGNVYEDMLLWGGHANGTNGWSPIDAVLNDYTRGNGFAMLPAANITVQHSTNSGSAWTTTSVTDLAKRNLVTNNQSTVRIVASGNVPNNATPQVRITIKCSGATYFQLKKIHLLISTNYSTGCTVTILGSLNSAPTTFNQTICSNVSISGWSGWNSITCDHTVGASTSQIHSLQFTFKQTGINPDHTNAGLNIYNISGYGYMKHTSPSALALWSHAYTINGDGDVTFPTKLYGAVWNDYAEFRASKDNLDIEPGRVVYETGEDSLALASERLIRGCNIVSDTYGFSLGESENTKLPIAVSGRVLAYPYENREEFKNHIGWPVCSGPNGTVSIMTEEEEEKYPSRIIGTISAVPDYEIWHGSEDVEINGRIWIKVR